MSIDPGDATWTVTELHEAVSGLLDHTFGPTLWVTGELRSLHRSGQGHSYFDLVEPGTDAQHGAARLSVTLFNGYRRRVNAMIKRHGGTVRIEDGTILRIGGELQTYAAQSRLQLVMTGIDPTYTMGVARQRRELVLAALSSDDLLGRNGALTLAHPPLHLAVITSSGSAAEADVIDELRRSGIGFRVRSIDARTQGAHAEVALVGALRTAEALGVDLVLLVRGGGSSADLGAFDSERLGRAIATLSTPVFTGIGHETDRTVADEIAHSAHKTPTAAAAAVVHRAHAAQREVSLASAAVRTAALGATQRADSTLSSTTRATALACRGHLVREAHMVEQRLARVAASAPLRLQRAVDRNEQTTRRLAAAVGASTGRADARLEHLAALVEARDPAAALARGWSITRTATGAVVRTASDVVPEDALVTTVAGGTITSVVTATGPDGRTPSDQ